MQQKVLLEEMTWPEVKAALEKADTVLVPIGSIEQHGPHLPLGTDAIAPFEFAKRVAEKIGALVAPAIRPGISPHHMPFPGTITLSPTTFIGLIQDYCRCLAKHGFKRIVLLNGHGGNSSCVGVAVTELHQELPDLQILAFDWWIFIPRELGRTMGMEEGIHANKMETSWMLALTPHLVNMEVAVAELPDYPEGMTPDKFGLFMSTVKTISDISKSGVVGDATQASKELGEECLSKAVENMARALEEIGKIRR